MLQYLQSPRGYTDPVRLTRGIRVRSRALLRDDDQQLSRGHRHGVREGERKGSARLDLKATTWPGADPVRLLVPRGGYRSGDPKFEPDPAVLRTFPRSRLRAKSR